MKTSHLSEYSSVSTIVTTVQKQYWALTLSVHTDQTLCVFVLQVAASSGYPALPAGFTLSLKRSLQEAGGGCQRCCQEIHGGQRAAARGDAHRNATHHLNLPITCYMSRLRTKSCLERCSLSVENSDCISICRGGVVILTISAVITVFNLIIIYPALQSQQVTVSCEQAASPVITFVLWKWRKSNMFLVIWQMGCYFLTWTNTPWMSSWKDCVKISALSLDIMSPFLFITVFTFVFRMTINYGCFKEMCIYRCVTFQCFNADAKSKTLFYKLSLNSVFFIFVLPSQTQHAINKREKSCFTYCHQRRQHWSTTAELN